MTPEYSQEFFLSAGETDAEGEISLPVLVSKIIDIATAHANSLGIGNPSMAALHCGWVLSRLAVEMERTPKVNETYRLTTWIETWNRHFSERIIMVSDGEGRPCGYARTIWMILDTETRQSVGLSHLSLPEGMISDRKCPIARIGKAPRVTEASPETTDASGRATAEVPAHGAATANREPWVYRFKYCDLDFYRHVNTVRYVMLLLNRYSLAEMDARRVRRMELAFMHEGKYDDTVRVLHSADAQPDTDLFSVTSSTGSEILAARLHFSPR